MANRFSIVDGIVVTPTQVLREGVVNVIDGKVVAVGGRDKIRPLKGAEILNANSRYVIPGFVDIHVHGAVGFDTMSASYEALEKISRFYAAHGTTSLLMTTISSPIDELIRAVRKVKEIANRGVSGSQVVGVHVEGPYYIYEQRGCHCPLYLRKPAVEEYLPLLDQGEGFIKMMSFSPELDGALELAQTLRNRGVIASMGHSNASYEQVMAAVSAGVTHCVHLYCAMSGVHQCGQEERPNPEFIPGASESVLVCDELTAEIISDGVHVHPALIRLILRCKGLDKIVLVTDAMHAAGVGDGEYAFGGMTVSVKDGIARTLDGVLASSTKPMDYMLKCFCEFTDLPLPKAVQAATLNPSRVIGIDSRKGSLEKGKDADIVTIDENFVVYDVFVMGKRVYQKS